MSQIGSGSLPVDLLPSAGIAVAAPGKRRNALAAGIAGAFRALPVPVIGRVKDGAFIMDLRCLERRRRVRRAAEASRPEAEHEPDREVTRSRIEGRSRSTWSEYVHRVFTP